jgi:hypothetical protein
MGNNSFMSRRAWVLAAALVFAVVGANSLHPRELYNQMYPVEALKRDAFHICNDADPTFIRAVWSEREACYNSMPHIIAVALGRVHPKEALTLAALTDPSRRAELMMMLATPPRQPVTAPRSFDNTSWLRSLSPSCADSNPVPPVSYTGPAGLGAAPEKRGSAALDGVVLGNLPPLPHAAKRGIAQQQDVPVIALNRHDSAPASSPPAAGNKAAGAAFAPLPTPDVGDNEAPAIVPLAPANSCGS